MKKCFLQYPCGKRFELKFPILILDDNNVTTHILPGSEEYVKQAKQKFQMGNLKVIVEEVYEKIPLNVKEDFISLSHKIHSIE